MESLDLSQKDSQFKNKWRSRIKGQPANPGLPRNWPLKRRVCHPVQMRAIAIIYLSVCSPHSGIVSPDTVYHVIGSSFSFTIIYCALLHVHQYFHLFKTKEYNGGGS